MRVRFVAAAMLVAGALGVWAPVAGAATVNYSYTATGWSVQHGGCYTDPRSGDEFPPSDAVSVVNPTASTISTGDSVTVRFDFSPALYVHSSAATYLGVAIRMTDPSYDSFGGYPTPTPTFSFTGTNIHSAATATSAGADNYQSNPYTPVIDYGVSGAPSLLIPDTSQDAVINSMSVSFTAPGGGDSNPDFSNTRFIARADVFARSSCPDPGPVLATTPSDATPPSAAPSQSPAANANGWNNSDVTVNWNWSDNQGGSGIDPSNCTTSSTSSGEGNPITLSATCTDLAGNTGSATYQVKVDKTAPLFTPSDISVDATSPAGATVTYTAAATDPGGSGVSSVDCSPQSGELFAIGDTTVNCTATDIAGNSTPGQFTVHVRGAAEQLAALLTAVAGVGPGNSLAAKVGQIESAVAAGNNEDACNALSAFIHELEAQTGKTLTAAQAASFAVQAQNIEATLGC